MHILDFVNSVPQKDHRKPPLRLWLRLLVISPVILLGQNGYAQGTLRFTATFDAFPPIAPESIIAIPDYFEGEMWFRAIGPMPSQPPYHLTRSGGRPRLAGWPYNSTAYLLAGFQDSLAVSFIYGRTFGVVSVDLSEFSTLYQTPLTVPFVGYLSDGSTVTTNFVTDGIIDGTGPLADFQTFYFDSRFFGLVRLEVPTDGWALDNLVFAVPEPTASALFLAGGLLLLAKRRRAFCPWCPRLEYESTNN